MSISIYVSGRQKKKITSTQLIKMRFQLLLLVLTSLVVFGTAVLENKPKRLKVTAENQWELSLPIGTQLVLDKRTQLYRRKWKKKKKTI